MRNKLVLISFVFLTTLAGFASATDISWTNSGGNGLWTTATNWSPTYVPSYYDKVQINRLPGPLISAGMGALCPWLVLSDGAPGALSMTGGTLYIFDVVSENSWFIIANNSSDTGTFTLDGGEVVIGTGSGLFVGYKGQGTIYMKGGTIEIWSLLGIGYCDTGTATGRGYVYLDGGTITAANFQMASPAGCTGLLNISSGTLIIDGDKTSLVTGYITDGRIIAYDGTGIVAVDYDITNSGKTTVRWLIDPQKAMYPNPSHNAVNVPPDVNLSWTAGVGATSHNVYFGTTSPGTLQCNQDANSYNLPVLDFNTTYYWRVDEVNEANTVTGVVWKFTTTDGLAKNPDPANDVTAEVVLDKVLNWTAGYGATSHDVYFGTDLNAVRDAERPEGDLDGDGRVDYNDINILTNYWLENPAGSVPYAGVNDDDIVDFADYALLVNNWMAQASTVFKGNQDANSYDPNLVKESSYYWRIDEVNGARRLKGNVWSFTTEYSLIGKVMCGYQGWFNCSGDGANRNWRHWPNSGTGAPTPTNIHVDMWPDMAEMDSDEKFLASSFYDGNNYYVFSSRNLKTVQRHFEWMQDYGIDGVYLQRFATEVINQGDSSFTNRNVVLDHCKNGANLYGKKYAVMYDLTGLGAGQMQSVINDWKYLVDTKKVTSDPCDHAYMHHRRKPVVAVWGIGFTGRNYTWAECLTLINFLKDDPKYGGNTVMIGVDDPWRSRLTDPTLLAIANKADIISPWSVGRYKYLSEITNFTNNVWIPDVDWCQSHSTPSHPIDYLPVIWPGFSWYNMHNRDSNYPLNQYPRNGGQFLWNQAYYTINSAHANMLYIAMFDEVDEGTAIFKVSNNPPRPGGVNIFVTYNMDGYSKPSDEYLWLTGQVGRALRGEIPVTSTRPARP